MNQFQTLQDSLSNAVSLLLNDFICVIVRKLQITVMQAQHFTQH